MVTGPSTPAPLATGIASSSAHLLSFAFTSAYVGSIYVSQHFFAPTATARQATNPPDVPSTDPKAPPPGSRDHPATIRLRMKAVGLATAASVAGVYSLVRRVGGYDWLGTVGPTARLLGLPVSLQDVPTSPLAYVLAPTLLLGPLVAMALDGTLPFQRHWSADFGLVEARNYLVGPVTEEIVFRSTILAVSRLGGLSQASLVFGTPMWFGLAHAHHALETYRRNGRTRQAAFQAIGISLFQLTYTTLFGWFASYLFMRTGSIIPPLLAHIFCNTMGIYMPNVATRRHPERKSFITAAYLLGIVGFAFGVRRL